MLIKTYRKLKEALESIPECNLNDTITFMEDEEFYGKSFEIFFSDETNDVLDIGHPYFVTLYRLIIRANFARIPLFQSQIVFPSLTI